MAELVKLMNMCMVTDPEGRVLVQNRKKNDWDGYTFPGGKVEPGEALTRAVIREVYEETGLIISHPKICGATEWHETDGIRHIVLYYKATEYTGSLHSSAEGNMEWMTLSELQTHNMAYGMEDIIKVFMNDDLAEVWYGKKDDGTYGRTIL